MISSPSAGSGGYSHAQRAFYGEATPPLHQREVGGSGGTLYISGMSNAVVKRNGCSSSFRSPGKHGEAHLEGYRHLSHDSRSLRTDYFSPKKSPSESRAGSAAFASKLDDRYSYLPNMGLVDRLFGAYDPSVVAPVSTRDHYRASSAGVSSPSSARGKGANSPSASFRSTTPIASAHIPKTKPIEPHFLRDDERLGGSPDVPSPSHRRYQLRSSPTASFRSSADRDSYIKAQPRRLDSYSPLKSDFDKSAKPSPRGGTSSFMTRTSIGDAHIRAMNKPVDVCLAYAASTTYSPRR